MHLRLPGFVAVASLIAFGPLPLLCGEAPTTEKSGRIVLASDPSGAFVSLDGDMNGTTPTELTGVAVGHHKLVLRAEGYEDWSTRVNVTAGGITTLDVDLVRSTGTLVLESTPPGLEYDLRLGTQRHRGVTPATLIGIPTGLYTATIQLPGWNPRESPVLVRRNQTTRSHATFEAGTVVITTIPTGATVTATYQQKGDDEPRTEILGTTPLTAILHPNAYDIVLDLPGYRSQTRRIQIHAQETASVATMLVLNTPGPSVSTEALKPLPMTPPPPVDIGGFRPE